MDRVHGGGKGKARDRIIITEEHASLINKQSFIFLVFHHHTGGREIERKREQFNIYDRHTRAIREHAAEYVDLQLQLRRSIISS